MSHFTAAIGVILRNEGGYVNHPKDPGGETNFGICKRNYPNVDIRNLTRDQAMEIYRRDYWRPIYDQIADPVVATKIFDMAVNMGHSQAHKLVQRAVGVTDDGKFGQATLAAVNAAENVIDAICRQHAAFYEHLIESKPELAAFRRGWMKRAEWPVVA